MDKSIFVDASAASNSLKRLEILSNNLANASTVGFRNDQPAFSTLAVDNNPDSARVYSTLEKTYSSFEQGPMIPTGRDLDVAIIGQGFIAVQSKTGQEAYTRAGDLQVKNGFLTTRNGELVLGNSGIISVPTNVTRVSIGDDGMVLGKIPGERDLVSLNRIKLVNPSQESLRKGLDGNFVMETGSAKFDENIKLNVRTVEGSNVNTVQALTELIELSRQFEFHTNLMHTYADNSSKLNQLLSLNS